MSFNLNLPGRGSGLWSERTFVGGAGDTIQEMSECQNSVTDAEAPSAVIMGVREGVPPLD